MKVPQFVELDVVQNGEVVETLVARVDNEQWLSSLESGALAHHIFSAAFDANPEPSAAVVPEQDRLSIGELRRVAGRDMGNRAPVANDMLPGIVVWRTA